ncbi:unnamed protein product [Ranitomeya imitator]|uniref:Core-binding (CB) domain-containing protein n=1 Tax=Ranitomeya imitator TaxID=111125 RepID=A0ABN9KXL8_9NEOB|nr:unnamed protein product [Ranitomeya imitator]
MLSARKASSASIYHRVWKTFFSWCRLRGHPPLRFSIPCILNFLQSGLDSGLALSSLKGQISALSVLFQRRIATNLQVKTFIQGVSHVVPPYRMPLETWDLNLVLGVLQEPPFEPLQDVPLSVLSWKVAFLVAVTSIRRVSELAALSCRAPFLAFHQDKVVLRPSPAFLPKVVSAFHLNEDIILPSFCPQPKHRVEKALHTLDVVRALRRYISRTAHFRKSDALFVLPEGHRKGAIKSDKKVKTEDKTSSAGKKKEKDKERKEKKEKDHSKSKQKKKKKKKKKKHSDYEGVSLDFLERSVSPVILSSSTSVVPNNTLTVKNATFQFPCAILSVDLTGETLSNMEFLDDSSTESLILSGDEYNQEFDSTNFEESQDEEEGAGEIVRCVCQMDEENGFMIQCEECLCWQHSICMGLLEDSIPEQYICYVCSDPPGQRWSARYKYDRDWFNSGRMCGLSFINENYSYLNAKKIVSTHHLLADVYGVTEILHGLQLKFGILKNKDHPDLRLWSLQGKGTRGQNHKGSTNKLGKTDETYITNEHSYQKPQDSGVENKTPNDTGKSEENNGVLVDGHKSNFHAEAKRRLSDHVNTERRTEQAVSADACNDKKAAEEQLDSHLQWQLNLLTHIENVQNEVTSRMDLIEKEVDVLESWLDFTGDLEPPDPLARLPQLKRRIKQLLIDMGKIQQITTLCSV